MVFVYPEFSFTGEVIKFLVIAKGTKANEILIFPVSRKKMNQVGLAVGDTLQNGTMFGFQKVDGDIFMEPSKKVCNK